MLSTFSVFLIAALLCVVLLLVLSSLFRSEIAGVREWAVANVLGLVAFALYAFGRELPPLIAYEAANGMYAAASAAAYAGFLRFFGRQVPWARLGIAVTMVMIAIAAFHYVHDSFPLRTATVAAFQGGICLAIGLTISQYRRSWRSSYPYRFTVFMAVIVAIGHAVRANIHFIYSGELTSLLQPSPWNIVFLSAGTMVLPVLTLGGIMMVHDKMMAKAEHAANRDFLTGAWSRRAFFQFAERELARARRTRKKLSVLVLDVDNFKVINDTSGHAIGDQVLVNVVLRAETVTRDIDYFARIGGEEFAMLLPDTDHFAAMVVAERLRTTLANPDTQDHGGSVIPAYTVSIGLATLHESESFQELMQRADAALYQAKTAGRNRVAAVPEH